MEKGRPDPLSILYENDLVDWPKADKFPGSEKCCGVRPAVKVKAEEIPSPWNEPSQLISDRNSQCFGRASRFGTYDLLGVRGAALESVSAGCRRTFFRLVSAPVYS